MPINLNETTAEQAAQLAAELQAMEQEAIEELWKKRASLRKAMEEAQWKVREEEEVTVREEALALAKAIRQAQEEQEIQGRSTTGFLY